MNGPADSLKDSQRKLLDLSPTNNNDCFMNKLRKQNTHKAQAMHMITIMSIIEIMISRWWAR